MEHLHHFISVLSSPSTFSWKDAPLSHWAWLPATWAVYWATILILSWFMKSRPKGFALDKVSAAHNMFLCVWSLVMFVFLVREMWFQYVESGLQSLFCVGTPDTTRVEIKYWLYIYYLSKFYELLDTVILLLKKKKPLEFLHWYHHSIVIAMVWLWLEYPLITASSGMAFNTFVHVIMYYYYYCVSLGRRVWFKRHVTQIQIIQFVVSFFVAATSFYLFNTVGCQETQHYAWEFSLACNLSFYLLFNRFYDRAYTPPKGAEGKKDEKKDE